MDRDKLAARLMATFLIELQDHLQTLNDDLLALEKSPGSPEASGHLISLFRTAHSLKGASRAVGVAPIEAACHAMEEILVAARDGTGMIAPALFPILFETADGFAEIASRLREKRDLSDAPIVELVPRLEAAARGMPLEAPKIVVASNGHAEEILPKEVAPPPVLIPSPSPVEAASTHVRVPAEKLDTLLSRSGELLVARRAAAARDAELVALKNTITRWSEEWRRSQNVVARADRANNRAAQAIELLGERLRRIDKEMDRLAAGAAADTRRVDRAAEELDQEVRRLRMLPFREACVGIDRAARDLASQCGKQVNLVIEGGDVELDRSVLQGLKDPLLHLVRNAVDHAVESPDCRRAAGKDPIGRVVVSAALQGGQVEVVVEDDGGGLDYEALRLRACRNGWAEPADDAEAAQLIFRAGFSTAKAITNVSGRGVGLDVVKDRVEALHGTIDVASVAGKGTRFTLGLPLTLTTLRTVLVEVDGQTFGLAGTNVRRLVKIGPGDIRSVRGRPVAMLGGIPWPVASLASILGLFQGEAVSSTGRQALLIAAGDRRVALTVDSLLAEQEVVVKSLGPRVRRISHVAGATILPSGRIALVLHAADLIRTALNGTVMRHAPAPVVDRKRRLLVVDDSITTRTLEQAILESAGYEVRTAADGEAGWLSLNEYDAELLVSDVDMPRLDGFGLTETVRSSERFRNLPIVLVTARATEADRARGAAAGADAYLVKSAFDQGELLATVARLL